MSEKVTEKSEHHHDIFDVIQEHHHQGSQEGTTASKLAQEGTDSAHTESSSSEHAKPHASKENPNVAEDGTPIAIAEHPIPTFKDKLKDAFGIHQEGAPEKKKTDPYAGHPSGQIGLVNGF